MEKFLIARNSTELGTAGVFSHESAQFVTIDDRDRGEFWYNYCKSLALDMAPTLTEVFTTIDTSLVITVKFEYDSHVFNKYSDRRGTREIKQKVSDTIALISRKISGLVDITFDVKGSEKPFITCLLEQEGSFTEVDGIVSTVYQLRYPYLRYLRKFTYDMNETVSVVVSNCLYNDEDTSESSSEIYPTDDSSGEDEDEDKDISQMIPLPVCTLTSIVSTTHDLMYGSSSSFYKKPLKLIGCYLNNLSSTDIGINAIFNFETHKYAKLITKYMESKSIDKVVEPEFWLPLLFSEHYMKKISTLKLTKGKPLKGRHVENVSIDTVFNDDTGAELHTKKMLSMCGHDRIHNPSMWDIIGRGIWSINKGAKGLSIWSWITRIHLQTGDADEKCKNKWFTFQKSQTTHKTIEWYASKDQPSRYNKFTKLYVEGLITKASLNPARTGNTAKAFEAFRPFSYGFFDDTWYEFVDHGWSELSSKGVVIRTVINDEFSSKIQEMINKTKVKKAHAESTEDAAECDVTIKHLETMCTNALNCGGKSTLVNELKSNYYNKFLNNNYFNTSKFITRTGSGVIDGSTDKVILRDGNPEDYQTKCAVSFDPDQFTWESDEIIYVMDYIKKVFPNKDDETFFWNLMCSFLIVGNTHKIFPIFTGRGNSGKSTLINLIRTVFRDYVVTIPPELVSSSSGDPNGATPALAVATGSRMALAQEVPKDREINTAVVKELTGGDVGYVRELYQKGSQCISVAASFTLTVTCNDVPGAEDDMAYWNRAKILGFDTLWVPKDEAPETEEEQIRLRTFPMDEHFTDKLKGMAPKMLWIIFHKFDEYRKLDNILTDKVKNATKKVKSQSNLTAQFLLAKVELHKDDDGRWDQTCQVNVTALVKAFGYWKKNEAGCKNKQVDPIKFREEIELITGQKYTKIGHTNVMYGFTLVQ